MDSPQKGHRGDEDTIKELYESTYRRVYFYLYRILQDRQTAEDILMGVRKDKI